jgi:hypothetical protein
MTVGLADGVILLPAPGGTVLSARLEFKSAIGASQSAEGPV